jgi:hypothetical protein
MVVDGMFERAIPVVRRTGGLPEIEPAAEIPLTCGNTEIDYAEQRESTRNDVRIRETC